MNTKDETQYEEYGVSIEEGLVDEIFFNKYTIRVFDDEVSFYDNGELQETYRYALLAGEFINNGMDTDTAIQAEEAIKTIVPILRDAVGREYNTFSLDFDIDFDLDFDFDDLTTTFTANLDTNVWMFGDLIQQTGYFPYERHTYTASWEKDITILTAAVLALVVVVALMFLAQVAAGVAPVAGAAGAISTLEIAANYL